MRWIRKDQWYGDAGEMSETVIGKEDSERRRKQGEERVCVGGWDKGEGCADVLMMDEGMEGEKRM